MVHPGSALMTGMFSCILCMFCLPKEHPHMFFFLGSRMFVIYYKSKYSSDMFYDLKFSEMVHTGSALMTGMFSHILCMFCLPKEHLHMFFPYQNPSAKAAFYQNIPNVIILIFLLQILCYSYSKLLGDVGIYFRLFQKISASIRGVEMMDAQVMFRMTIFSSGLLSNKQPSTTVGHIDANSCPHVPRASKGTVFILHT